MADTDHVLNLAAIIREVDGTPSKGAAALAESILDHPRFRAVLAEEPAAVTEQPSDEELALIYHDCCQGCEFMDQGGFEDGARAVLVRWGNPTPQPPADGEVAGLVAKLRRLAPQNPLGTADPTITRAADLLERQALVPVSVSERPWEREGWCDVEGRFWAEHISRSGVASWRCAAASDLGGWAVRCLPAHALPQPEVGE